MAVKKRKVASPAKLDAGWEVEWCYHLPPLYPGADEADLDNAKYHRRNFATRDEALAFARQVYPEDRFGEVRISLFEMVPISTDWPRGRHREYIGEPEFYSGDD
jgi:hypothetical protein